MTMNNPICLALDTPDVDRAVELARTLKHHVGYLKIGMEFFMPMGRKPMKPWPAKACQYFWI